MSSMSAPESVASVRRAHILKCHVNLTQAEALERMLFEGLDATSLWQDERQLDAVTDLVLARQANRIDMWSRKPDAQRPLSYAVHASLDDDDARLLGHPTTFFGFVRQDWEVRTVATRSVTIVLRSLGQGAWCVYNAYPDVRYGSCESLGVPAREFLVATRLWAHAEPLRRACFEAELDRAVRVPVRYVDGAGAIEFDIAPGDGVPGVIRLSRGIMEVRVEGDLPLRMPHGAGETILSLAIPETMFSIRTVRAHIERACKNGTFRNVPSKLPEPPSITFPRPEGTTPQATDEPADGADVPTETRDADEDAPMKKDRRALAREKAARRSRNATAGRCRDQRRQAKRKAKSARKRDDREESPVTTPKRPATNDADAAWRRDPMTSMFWDILVERGLFLYNPQTCVLARVRKGQRPSQSTMLFSNMPSFVAANCVGIVAREWDGDVTHFVEMPDALSEGIAMSTYASVDWRRMPSKVRSMAHDVDWQLLATDAMANAIREAYGVTCSHRSLERALRRKLGDKEYERAYGWSKLSYDERFMWVAQRRFQSAATNAARRAEDETPEPEEEGFTKVTRVS